MEPNTTRTNPFLMLIDKDAINAAIERAANCRLPRRECRPLDKYKGKRVNADLARYDEAVDLDDMTDDELEFDTIEDTVGVRDDNCSDDNFGEDDY